MEILEVVPPRLLETVLEIFWRSLLLNQGRGNFGQAPKIVVGQQLTLDVPDDLVHGGNEFPKVLLVQEEFVFLVPMFIDSFAFRDRDEEVITGPSRFHIKKISALTRWYSTGKNFITILRRV